MNGSLVKQTDSNTWVGEGNMSGNTENKLNEWQLSEKNSYDKIWYSTK